MISKIIKRYIWLLNLLLPHKAMTFEEIAKNWETSNLNDGKPLARRTFHEHRKAIKELFGVEIKCNTSTNKYYLSSETSLRNNTIQKWLLSSFTVSNMIKVGHNMKDRIFFEDIPKGTDYIPTVTEAMQQNKVLLIDYQPFDQHQKTLHFCPYAMKIYNQRWYMVGLIQEQESIRTIAFDRIRTMDSTEARFDIPKTFSAQKLFADRIGIFVDDKTAPQKVILKAHGPSVDYLRSLPLHSSQEEIAAKHGIYSDFQYKIYLNPELETKILAMGENIEVLEPKELRDKIADRLQNAIKRYK